MRKILERDIPHVSSSFSIRIFNSKLTCCNTVSESFSFGPCDIYPCSQTCSTQSKPCPNCLDPSLVSPIFAAESNSPFPSFRLLPREPLRLVYTQFLQAVRNRLIDDMCESLSDGRRLGRLGNGLIIFPPTHSSDWGAGWEHHTKSR